PDGLERPQRLRVAPDKLAAPVAGHHMLAGLGDSPALAVVGDGLKQLHGLRVPAQRDSLAPGQLPGMITGVADALAEKFGRERDAPLGIRRTELIADQ